MGCAGPCSGCARPAPDQGDSRLDRTRSKRFLRNNVIVAPEKAHDARLDGKVVDRQAETLGTIARRRFETDNAGVAILQRRLRSFEQHDIMTGIRQQTKSGQAAAQTAGDSPLRSVDVDRAGLVV